MTLRMPKSIHCGQIHVDDKFVILTENFEKNHDFLRFLEFIQNHSRIIQGSFPELQDIKIHDRTAIQAPLGLSEEFQKFDLKRIILMTFWTHFFHFRHADACVACGKSRGQSSNDS